MPKYHFEKYNLNTLAHLERHLSDSKVPGSVFHRRFKTSREIADLAYELIKDIYKGERLETTIECDEIVGEEGVIAIAELPIGATWDYAQRLVGEDIGIPKRNKGYRIPIAHNVRRKPTNLMTIIAEPIPGNEKIHTFSTIYPGKLAPDFTDIEFWKNHALISVC